MRFLAPLLIGLVGAAVLVSLGIWQMQRLEWKEAMLAEIDARIGANPVKIPKTLDPERDRFLPVTASGAFLGEPLRILVSQKRVGAGYRLIQPFETEGRLILVDRGFIPVAQETALAPEGGLTVTGNLHWPDEIDGFTPAPEFDKNLAFARDVPTLAAHFETEETLLIAASFWPSDEAVDPLPVSTDGIPNDHLEYAVTWFSLSVVWLGMTGLWLWRMAGARERKEQS